MRQLSTASSHNVNCGLINSQFDWGKKDGMEPTTLTSRIQEAIGDDNGYEVSKKVTAQGHAITPQAVYKWLDGNAISEPALLALCRAYHCEPAYIRYGVGPLRAMTDLEQRSAELFATGPLEPLQLSLDFLQYQIHKPPALIAGDKVARYIALIEHIKSDMDKRNGNTGKP